MDIFKSHQLLGSKTRRFCCVCNCSVCSAYIRRFKKTDSRKARRMLRKWDKETHFGEKDVKLRPDHILRKIRILEKHALSKI